MKKIKKKTCFSTLMIRFYCGDS